VRSAFQIPWNSFLNWAASGRCCPSILTVTHLVARNFHIKVWRIQTIIAVVQTIDLMHAISIYEAWASEPWRLSSGLLNYECMTCLMNLCVRTGTHITQTVAAVFPYLYFGKKSHSWSNTERRLNMLLKRPDGCNLEQFETSRHRGRSWRKVLVVGTDDAWTVECPDDITRRPDDYKGTELTALNSAQSLLWSSKLKFRLQIKQYPCIISIIT